MLQIKVVEYYISYKKVSEHICLSPPGVLLGSSKDCLSSLKYYIVLKWESGFTLRLDTAKNAYYIKKCFK